MSQYYRKLTSGEDSECDDVYVKGMRPSSSERMRLRPIKIRNPRLPTGMSQYYRILNKGELFKRGDVATEDAQGKFILRPVEVDSWHPASEPPKPEDFEPTGFVDHVWKEKHQWFWDDVSHADFVTSGLDCFEASGYWRKISIPK